MLTDLQKQTAQAIINIFETGKVLGDYTNVTSVPSDPGGLTYGKAQTTINSGNLFLLIKAYCDAENAQFAEELRAYLDRLEDKDKRLNRDLTLHGILRQAGLDPVMQDTQDEFFDRVYWNPSVSFANRLGIQTALGTAVVYDSILHGSWGRMRDRTINNFGTVANIGEKIWISHYVDVRRDWLASHSIRLLRKTVGKSMTLEDIINNNKVINLNELKADNGLLKQVQRKLNSLGLYPGGPLIDGIYGSRTQAALVEFCDAANLDSMNTSKFDRNFAETLLNFEVLPFALEGARDRKRVLSHFLAEGKATANKLAFLDRGINNSPYKEEIKHYPDRLKEKPDGQNVVSYGQTTVLAGTNQTVTFSSYPTIGAGPDSEIDEQSLNFLDKDITHACVCIGSFVEGDIKVHWLGKNAQDNTQFWSATKIIPILNVVSQANQKFPDSEAGNWVINNHPFFDLVKDVFSYQERIASSNALAAMFKQFQTPKDLESWTQKITGNNQLTFRGKYFDPPFIARPKLLDKTTQQVLLTAPPVNHNGKNLLSAYDLTRFISLVGWHHHIPQEARLLDAQWHSLQTIVKAMGTDKARYADAAIKRLGLESAIKSPVILSKLGNGDSQSRQKTEIVYVGFIQFIDERPKAENKPAKLRTISMTLRGAKNPGQTVDLDAMMAAEVTEVLRRVVTEELA